MPPRRLKTTRALLRHDSFRQVQSTKQKKNPRNRRNLPNRSNKQKKAEQILCSASHLVKQFFRTERLSNYSLGNGGVVGAAEGVSVGVVCEETFASDSFAPPQPTLLKTNATKHKLATLNHLDTCILLKMECS